MKKIGILLALSLTSCGQASTVSTAGMTIASQFNCSKIYSGYTFAFQGVTYSTGDAWVTCEVSGNATQSSSTRIYKSTQAGATSFSCLITFDSEAPLNSGYWTFTSGTSKKAVYTDTGATINGLAVTFASTDCSGF